MIAEPYICIKGQHFGEIHWLNKVTAEDGSWQPYADFEREKLRELHARLFQSQLTPGQISRCCYAYALSCSSSGNARDDQTYLSDDLIGYSSVEYSADSESSRLLKRAEFLKAVCEKEGVEWLPKRDTLSNSINREHEDKMAVLRFRKDGRHLAECGQDECVTNGCRCPCHKVDQADRDYYTKDEIDKLHQVISDFITKACNKNDDEERKWRKGLLKILGSEPRLDPGVQDLRRRFT